MKIRRIFWTGLLSLVSFAAQAELLWTHTLSVPGEIPKNGYITTCGPDQDLDVKPGGVICSKGVFSMAIKPISLSYAEYLEAKAPPISGKKPVPVGLLQAWSVNHRVFHPHFIIFYKYE